jgi:hypothetical protein
MEDVCLTDPLADLPDWLTVERVSELSGISAWRIWQRARRRIAAGDPRYMRAGDGRATILISKDEVRHFGWMAERAPYVASSLALSGAAS